MNKCSLFLLERRHLGLQLLLRLLGVRSLVGLGGLNPSEELVGAAVLFLSVAQRCVELVQ